MANIIIPFLTCFFQPCYATITRWIKKFGKIAVQKTSKIKLKAGRRRHWEIDEQYDSRIVETEENSRFVKNGKKKCGTFGIIDPYTKLISIETFEHNLNKKAKNMMLRAIYRWQTKPRSCWRDGWNGYDKILQELNRGDMLLSDTVAGDIISKSVTTPGGVNLINLLPSSYEN